MQRPRRASSIFWRRSKRGRRSGSVCAGRDEKPVWTELRDAELKPWIHRRITTAAKLPPDTDLTAFESFRQGHLSRTTSRRRPSRSSADPDPGERWWDVNADNGLHSLHLAAS